jgi:adenylate cyclase
MVVNMAIEIERKFLLKNDAWRGLAAGTLYRQGYIYTVQGCSVTVQVTDALSQINIATIEKEQENIEQVAIATDVARELMDVFGDRTMQSSSSTSSSNTSSSNTSSSSTSSSSTSSSNTSSSNTSSSISTQAGHTVRVRTVNCPSRGDFAVLTLKTKTVGLSRAEFEFELPMQQGQRLLDRVCDRPLIEKYRYKIPVANFVWEVDEFLGENQGLILAEVELEDETQRIEMPDWIGTEVSSDPRYFNSFLAKTPFTTW